MRLGLFGGTAARKGGDAKALAKAAAERLKGQVRTLLGLDEAAAIAVNLRRDELTGMLWGLPEPLACVRTLVSSVGIAVVADPPTIGYATNLPEPATRACLDRILPVMGGRTRTGDDGSYQLLLGDGDGAALRWGDGMMTAAPLDVTTAPEGPPSPRLRALVEQVPTDVHGFLLSAAYPKYQVHDAVAWLRVAPSSRKKTSSPGSSSIRPSSSPSRTTCSRWWACR